ncbi:response regulator [Noviherbaspirillum pedocola]|uniref:Response regulator n=1 Tax=Noviherbaspirillum pedocola TaxID=2801341 RepID=A0A934SUH1_9BURK|nr:response regulator [Noviherbaspirillum pedocola]MBK4735937.1 response regulator [Noviherbaspirillum pedocola]
MNDSQDISAARILVVDDMQDNVDLMIDVLNYSGFTNVTGTSDPRAVAPLHAANDYDLILLDIQMPGMDGFEVMRCLRTALGTDCLPVVACTAHHDYLQKVLAAGACDLIKKPIDLADANKRIRRAIEHRYALRRAPGWTK